MKILHVLGTGNRGGTETNVLRMLEKSNSRDKHSVVSLSSGEFVERETQKNNISFKKVEKVGLFSIFELYQYCKREKFDVVNSYGFKAALISRFLRLILKFTLISNVRGDGFLTGVKLLFEKLTSFLTSGYVFNSTNAMENYLKHSIKSEDNLHIVLNGINGNWESCPPKNMPNETLEIGTVANFTKHKNYQKMFEVIEAVARELFPKKINYNIAGIGSQKDFFEQRFKNSEMSNLKISFLGEIDDIESFLDNTDIFLFISHQEGLPNAVIEAMLKGIPVCANEVGGIQDLIKNNISGYLLNTNEEFVEKIVYIADHPDKAKKVGREARIFVLNNLTLKNQYLNTMEIYNKYVL